MVAACHTATSYFNLWLKSAGYSVVDANIYPTGGSALNIVATVIWGIIADRTGQNYTMIVIVQALMILSNILLSVWYIPKGALMFAYYLSYAGSAATPVLIVSNHLTETTCATVSDMKYRAGPIDSTRVILVSDNCSWPLPMSSPMLGFFGYHVS